jgi:lantibiotic biosynthesis protein
MSAGVRTAGPARGRLMRVQAAPDGDALVFEGAGASPQPLLSGELKERAMHWADALTETLRPAPTAGSRDGSLSYGSAGLAICSAQFARTRGDRQRADAALAHIEDAVDVLATEALTSSLYSGFTGIAWAAQIVDRLLGIEGEDRNGDIDDALAGLLQRYPDHAPYDLIHGLTGMGVYLLTRWPRPGAGDCLFSLVGQLARRARQDRDGIYWWTAPSWHGPHRERRQPGGVDLGVAHGIAGVIPFLARVHRLGLAQQAAGPLLDGAVQWLLAHLVDTPSGPTVPYFAAGDVEPGPARSAWCYGDPGVAAALLLAANDVGEPTWAEAATGLALRAAARPPDQTGVVDACLCHGSAGLAHLFNRMYQMTAEAALADAARFWVEWTVDRCSAAASGDAARRAWKGPGLLEGAAGVALALEAASTTVEPVWDQMLLVSTAGARAAEAP